LARLEPTLLSAVEFRGVIEEGTSRPLRVLCERTPPDGGTVEVVLKLRDPQVSLALPWSLCLGRELAAAFLARAAGLSVPDYAIVAVSQPFVDSCSRSGELDRLQANIGPNFGSVLITPVLELPLGHARLWAGPLSFDAMLLNGDRTAVNPNALFDGDQLYLIDHGLVAPTWEIDAQGKADMILFGTDRITSHAGFTSVFRQGQDYLASTSALAQLFDRDQFDSLRAWLPQEWLPQEEVDRLFAFLVARATIAHEQAEELKGVVR
jgi:hypothetical protein